MSNSDSFNKVVKGGTLFTVGRFSQSLVGLIAGLIVIRLLPRAEYGTIATGNVFISIIVIVSTLGFGNGVPRLMGKYRAQADTAQVKKVAGTALLITICTSIFGAIMLFFMALHVAGPFQNSALQYVLQLLSLVILPSTTMLTLTAIYRGYENVRAKILFQDICIVSLRLFLFIAVIITGLGFHGILWSYVVAAWLALGFYILYSVRHLRGRIHLQFNGSVARELILFSFPLLGVVLIGNLMNWAGTLTLSYLKTAVDVGMFNAPLRLVSVIPIPLNAMVFLYLPVATKLVYEKNYNDLQQLYRRTTKLVVFISLPLLLYLMIDAEFVIEHLLGDQYIDTGNILRVLIVGASFHTFLGPNGSSLIAHGENRSVLIGTLVAGFTAVLLCFVLIPGLGALGAAIGNTVAMMISNSYLSLILYRKYRIHPFSNDYTRPLGIIVALSIILDLLGFQHSDAAIYHILIVLLIIVLITGVLILSKSLTENDLTFLSVVEKKISNKTYCTDLIKKWKLETI